MEPSREARTQVASIKDDLLRPEAYAAVVRAKRVALEETHISWVFLLERDVFKVKKPVDLGFLDFRGIEQRRAACEAEVRLNKRLAPGVYRGVVPIGRGGRGRLRVGGRGRVVDWAVHMVRLPAARRADQLLARGALTPDAVDLVARRIAAFHASAAHGDREGRYGAPEVIEGNIEENFAQSSTMLEQHLSPDEAVEIVRWQTAFVRGHRALLEERMATGRVRDGHGDLRLEHLYIDEAGGITILDCIEFNERFRFADVCADVAFFSMDLAAHGRVDLAERFVASYARESNDFDLYAVIDFYESYRAFVRGKLAAMRANDASSDEASRRRAAVEARRYFLMALSADRRSLLLPSVVAVGGVIASGKSTVASRIADAIGAPVIDADRTRKAMLGVDVTQAVEDAAWQGAYDPVFTERVYAEVLRRADVVLASGRPVVVDASFRSRSMREALRALAGRRCIPFRLVECRAPPAVCRARMLERERTRDVSDGRIAIFDDFCTRFEAITELPPFEHIAIDTTRPLDESLEALRSQLDAWPPGLAG